ncbi:MAG TPA: YhjD/YihY/BrkB family envelope integrity protein [Thermodesulfobacteriota bacterium]
MLARTGRLLVRAARRFHADDASTRAAALTFRTLLSIVPFLAVFFAVLSAFGPFARTEARLEAFLLEHLLPGTARAAIAHLTRLTEKTAAVGAVGFVALVATSLLLLGAIEDAFRHIHRLPEGRSFRQRLLSYWTTLTVAPLLFGVSIYLSGAATRLSPRLVPDALLDILRSGEILWGYLVPLLVSTGAFTLGYLVLPAASVRLAPALAGGATAGLLWEAGKAAFDWYVRRFASFEQVYGALALVPIFLLWVQVTWLIVLFGAEVAYCAQHPDPGPETAPARRDGPARGPLAARVLWSVAREFTAGRPRPTVAGVAAELSVEAEAVERAVGALERAGLVARVAEPGDAEGGTGLLPARPLDQVTVADALRAGEAEGGGLAEGAEAEEPLLGLLRAAAGEVEERLGRETYASLASRWQARQRAHEAAGAIGMAEPATLPEGLVEGREP